MTTTPPHRRAFVGALVLVATTIATRQVLAEDDADAQRGAQLFTEGKAALDKKDFVTACAKFVESIKVAPRPNVVFNLAQCEEHERRLISARKHWAEGQTVLDSQDPRVAIAKEKIAALDKRIGSLLLRVSADTPPEAHVKIDGVEIDKKTLGTVTPMDPGVHTVTLQALGREERSVSITLAEGEKKDWTLSPGAQDASYVPSAAAGAPKPPEGGTGAPGPQPEVAPRSSTRRTVGLVVGGVGLVGIGVGLAVGAMASSQYKGVADQCPENRCTPAAGAERDSAASKATVATIIFGVGTAALVGGGVLWLTAPSKKTSAGSASASAGHRLTIGFTGSAAVLKGVF